jgi:adenosylhomocysteine nucleosidase
MRIGIVAALPGELQPLVKGWRRAATDSVKTKKWTLSQGDDMWIAACAGIGAEAARRAFVAAESDGPLDMVLSVGWAGSLYDGVSPGTVQVPTIVIDAQTGEQFSLTKGTRKWTLVTTVDVADAREKARLRASYNGALVDMESAAVARLAEMRGIPLICIKGVSDAVGANLPNLNPFIDKRGQMRMIAFLAHVALRPQYWPALGHLGRNSARASKGMRDLILDFMEEKNVEKLIATGSV